MACIVCSKDNLKGKRKTCSSFCAKEYNINPRKYINYYIYDKKYYDKNIIKRRLVNSEYIALHKKELYTKARENRKVRGALLNSIGICSNCYGDKINKNFYFCEKCRTRARKKYHKHKAKVLNMRICLPF